LGFPDGDHSWQATMDVDAILPAADMAKIEADDGFWNALEAVNWSIANWNPRVYILLICSRTDRSYFDQIGFNIASRWFGLGGVTCGFIGRLRRT